MMAAFVGRDMDSLFNPVNVTWINVVTSVPLALVLGLLIAVVYRRTMTNFSYSVPIMHTIVYLAMIVSLIMIIVANELVRAFTLLGAFAVIRFRTPIKDARDGAFIFLALAAGMGVGVGLYAEAALGVALIALFVWLMHESRFGLTSGRETLLTLTVPQSGAGHRDIYGPVFAAHLRGYDLINVRSIQAKARLELTFYVRPNRDVDMAAFSAALAALPEVEDVSVVVSQDDEIPDNVF